MKINKFNINKLMSNSTITKEFGEELVLKLTPQNQEFLNKFSKFIDLSPLKQINEIPLYYLQNNNNIKESEHFQREVKKLIEEKVINNKSLIVSDTDFDIPIFAEILKHQTMQGGAFRFSGADKDNLHRFANHIKIWGNGIHLAQKQNKHGGIFVGLDNWRRLYDGASYKKNLIAAEMLPDASTLKRMGIDNVVYLINDRLNNYQLALKNLPEDAHSYIRKLEKDGLPLNIKTICTEENFSSSLGDSFFSKAAKGKMYTYPIQINSGSNQIRQINPMDNGIISEDLKKLGEESIRKIKCIDPEIKELFSAFSDLSGLKDLTRHTLPISEIPDKIPFHRDCMFRSRVQKIVDAGIIDDKSLIISDTGHSIPIFAKLLENEHLNVRGVFRFPDDDNLSIESAVISRILTYGKSIEEENKRTLNKDGTLFLGFDAHRTLPYNRNILPEAKNLKDKGIKKVVYLIESIPNVKYTIEDVIHPDAEDYLVYLQNEGLNVVCKGVDDECKEKLSGKYSFEAARSLYYYNKLGHSNACSSPFSPKFKKTSQSSEICRKYK